MKEINVILWSYTSIQARVPFKGSRISMMLLEGGLGMGSYSENKETSSLFASSPPQHGGHMGMRNSLSEEPQ